MISGSRRELFQPVVADLDVMTGPDDACEGITIAFEPTTSLCDLNEIVAAPGVRLGILVKCAILLQQIELEPPLPFAIGVGSLGVAPEMTSLPIHLASCVTAKSR